MTDDASYEVHALRYSQRAAQKDHEFFRYALYGEPDEAIGMDYYFWLVRGGGRTVLVDSGYNAERAAAKGRLQDTDPLELLDRMDVRAEDVEHVVISHLHWDHTGNLDLFPNATFSIAREELDFWSGPFGERELLAKVVDQVEIRLVQQMLREERLQLVDGESELFPGIRATRLGGHTPGQLMVEVGTGSGSVVLASDASHYYEEFERDRPFNLFTDIEGLYLGYDVLRDLRARPGTTVVPGHDPRVGATFAQVRPECFDLTSPLGT
jgi:glyoxylase-like metal-dependent hydrolase (beta-lactamase superfamily II)